MYMHDVLGCNGTLYIIYTYTGDVVSDDITDANMPSIILYISV